MNIVLDEELISLAPDFRVGVIEADVKVKDVPEINGIIKALENEINDSIDIKDVVNLDVIKEGRDAYKRFGKDPSRYRLSVESLYRRLSKGNKLYRINNLVDLGNVVSIKTRRPVAVLDYNKISGDNILIRLGKDTDEYYGIGRGKLNITNIPVYVDDLNAFGSSTSDTERTMIRPETNRILLFIICLSKNDNITQELQETISLFEKYAEATNITSYIV